MNIKTIEKNNVKIAVVQSDQLLITDAQSALDLIATVSYETGCYAIAVNKENITEDFFQLSTRLAGEILQKFVNYRMKIAIIGDFSVYASKALKDFIYECNQGDHIFFVSTEEEAIATLA